MFTILTTWISERIITVTAVSVLTVAAVPTTLIIVSHDDHNTIAEAGCTTQVTQAVTTSKVAAKIQPQLTTAKSQLHGSVAPVVAAIKADEDHFAHLTFVTPQDEENELEHLKLIEVIALGDGHSAGTITVICQTVMITITETIQITIIQTTPAPCTKDERDTD